MHPRRISDEDAYSGAKDLRREKLTRCIEEYQVHVSLNSGSQFDSHIEPCDSVYHNSASRQHRDINVARFVVPPPYNGTEQPGSIDLIIFSGPCGYDCRNVMQRNHRAIASRPFGPWRRHFDSIRAPKARKVTARGVAPGMRRGHRPGCSVRASPRTQCGVPVFHVPDSTSVGNPLSFLYASPITHPGRCPGLSHHGPSGLGAVISIPSKRRRRAR